MEADLWYNTRLMAKKIKDPRPGWDDYFMNIAQVVATRSNCSRRHVGAVIVRNRHILAGV